METVLTVSLTKKQWESVVKAILMAISEFGDDGPGPTWESLSGEIVDQTDLYSATPILDDTPA